MRGLHVCVCVCGLGTHRRVFLEGSSSIMKQYIYYYVVRLEHLLTILGRGLEVSKLTEDAPLARPCLVSLNHTFHLTDYLVPASKKYSAITNTQ